MKNKRRLRIYYDVGTETPLSTTWQFWAYIHIPDLQELRSTANT